MKSQHRDMLPSVERCVGALTDTLARLERPERCGEESLGKTVAFILETQARMPDYLRLVFRVLTLIFDAWPYVVTGKPFHRLDLARRIDQVEHWGRSRLTFRQAVIAFYRSFTIFVLYSELSKEDAHDGVRDKCG
ncbi:hypothetical protein [Sinorhizobium meliloti]|uniref:hypothetical protein n=1 Tax=Rhizobium meliloti TaxID=382 RepID=UPI000518CA1D|nr:hypothetical protein [Sinorhizobium meliloti]